MRRRSERKIYSLALGSTQMRRVIYEIRLPAPVTSLFYSPTHVRTPSDKTSTYHTKGQITYPTG